MEYRGPQNLVHQSENKFYDSSLRKVVLFNAHAREMKWSRATQTIFPTVGEHRIRNANRTELNWTEMSS